MVILDQMLEHLPAVPLLIAAALEAAVIERSRHRPRLCLPQSLLRHRELRDVLQANNRTWRVGVIIDVVC